jgi:formate hydrogenlyase subunit 4
MSETIIYGITDLLTAMVLAPALFGVINKTKAFFAGRTGQPVMQLYYDIFKQLRKGTVYSRSVTWIFKFAPVAGAVSVLTALAIVPRGADGALIAFPGDFVLMVYLLGMGRFFMILSALDTASSFCGMGASREAQFSALAEPALLLSLFALATLTGEYSLSSCVAALGAVNYIGELPVLFLLSASFLIIFLLENCRVPFDDPNTHLELTMVHEAMILDNSGPDLGLILYNASLKFWILGSLVVCVLFPAPLGGPLASRIYYLCGMFLLAVVTGAVESCMARLRLLQLPQIIIGALALSVMALIFAWL